MNLSEELAVKPLGTIGTGLAHNLGARSKRTGQGVSNPQIGNGASSRDPMI